MLGAGRDSGAELDSEAANIQDHSSLCKARTSAGVGPASLNLPHPADQGPQQVTEPTSPTVAAQDKADTNPAARGQGVVCKALHKQVQGCME